MIDRGFMLFLVVVALLAAACSSAGGSKQVAAQPTQSSGSGGTSSRATAPAAASNGQPSAQSVSQPASTATAVPSPTPVPNPLTVKVVAEQGKKATARIPVEGGTLKATGTNGVQFTLTLPKDALMAPEQITLAPLSSVDGLPLSGGLLGGVQLEPEGLMLMKPAALTIEVPSGFKTQDLVGFAYQGTGEEFHLYPVTAEGSTITAQLMHFSGYGGGQGSQQDTDNQRQRQPSDSEARADQDIAEMIEQARRSGRELSSDEMDEMERILRDWFNDSVTTRLNAAETNDAMLEPAVFEAVTWLHDVALLQLDDRFGREKAFISSHLAKAFQNALDKALGRCVRESDIDQAAVMLRRAREAQLLGLEVPGWSSDQLDSKLQKCLSFRLDFESIAEWEFPNLAKTTSHVKAEVPLKMNVDLSFQGEGRLQYLEFTAEFAGGSERAKQYCQFVTEKHPGSIKILPFNLLKNYIKDKGTEEGRPVFALLMTIDPLTEKLTQQCKYVPPVRIGGNISFWYNSFDKVNEKRKDPSDFAQTYLFDEFTRGQGKLVARSTGNGSTSDQSGSYKESFTIDVIHTPGQ